MDEQERKKEAQTHTYIQHNAKINIQQIHTQFQNKNKANTFDMIQFYKFYVL